MPPFVVPKPGDAEAGKISEGIDTAADYENKDDTPIGFASFSAHDDPSVYHLHKIYVLPDEQGKNVGKQLLDYIISDIKAAGATSLQLNVNRFNKALHFYEKQGFKILREEDIDIGSGFFMNDYVMEKKI